MIVVEWNEPAVSLMFYQVDMVLLVSCSSATCSRSWSVQQPVSSCEPLLMQVPAVVNRLSSYYFALHTIGCATRQVDYKLICSVHMPGVEGGL